MLPLLVCWSLSGHVTCILPIPARPCASHGHWEVEATDFYHHVNLFSAYFLSAVPMVLRKKQKQEKAFVVMSPSGEKEENTVAAPALLEANSDLERAEGGAFSRVAHGGCP